MWSNLSQIRTESLLNFFERHGLCSIFKVVGKYQLVIVNINEINKSVDDLLLILRIIGVTVFKAADPTGNLLLRITWSLHLSLQNADFQFITLSQRPVYVTAQDCDTVAHRIISTLANLPFDALFSLAFRGVSGVDDCFRFFVPPSWL